MNKPKYYRNAHGSLMKRTTKGLEYIPNSEIPDYLNTLDGELDRRRASLLLATEKIEALQEKLSQQTPEDRIIESLGDQVDDLEDQLKQAKEKAEWAEFCHEYENRAMQNLLSSQKEVIASLEAELKAAEEEVEMEKCLKQWVIRSIKGD